MGKPTVRYFSAKDEKSEGSLKKTKLKKKSLKFETDNKYRKKNINNPTAFGVQNTNESTKKIPNSNNQFPGRVQIPKETLQRYHKGIGLSKDGVRTNIHQKKFEAKEAHIKFSEEAAARAEILLIEDAGYLEADSGETTTQFTQSQIVNNVDITAATKHFELRLKDFGPYTAKYTRNGRHLLLGGKLGHVAAFDWVTKKLHCEINVMESIHDISWLHIETMFAVAQKNWVYIYDNQGIELHCVKKLNKVARMEFLPYHFLLATASDEGYLSWLDISLGQLASQYNTKLGKLNVMTQNPYNALLCVGHAKGVVSMWAPSTRDPLAKMLCHKGPITALHVDPKGVYMATSSTDHTLKVWDIRQLKPIPLQIYRIKTAADNLAFSQNNMLAVGMGNVVEVYRDCCINTANRAYIRHRMNTRVGSLNFCPYEDVLGVGSTKGFTSLIVPGCGEANFDALEANPYQTKSQRKEAEVKALLEKIQPELITLDPTVIAEVDVPTLKDKMEAKKKLLFVKPPKIDYNPRNKGKRRMGINIAKNKKIVQEAAKREFLQNMKKANVELPNVNKSKKSTDKSDANSDVLERFAKKR